MRALRFVVRVTVFMLVGFAISFGVVAIFKAQIKLDQLVALYLESFEARPQLATASTRPASAPSGPRAARELPPTVTRDAEPAADARVAAETEVQDAVANSQPPSLSSPQVNDRLRTSRIATRWSQIASGAMPTETSKAIADRVNNAQGVVDLALPDRPAQEARPIGGREATGADADHDDGRFSSVKVHRAGAEPTVHKVPKEFPKLPREW